MNSVLYNNVQDNQEERRGHVKAVSQEQTQEQIIKEKRSSNWTSRTILWNCKQLVYTSHTHSNCLSDTRSTPTPMPRSVQGIWNPHNGRLVYTWVYFGIWKQWHNLIQNQKTTNQNVFKRNFILHYKTKKTLIDYCCHNNEHEWHTDSISCGSKV